MKRLFAIRKPNGKLLSTKGNVEYFSNKELAKQARKEANGTDEDGNELYTHTIAAGPDHWRYTNEH